MSMLTNCPLMTWPTEGLAGIHPNERRQTESNRRVTMLGVAGLAICHVMLP